MKLSMRGFVRLSQISFATFVATLLVVGVTGFPVAKTEAATATLYPTGQGTYNQWSGSSYTGLDEHSSFSCSYSSDAILGDDNNDAESYTVDLSGVPNGSIITSISVKTYSRDSIIGNDNGKYEALIRFNGSDSVSSDISPSSDSNCSGPNTKTFNVVDTVKGAGTTLEIGVKKANASSSGNVIVGAIHAEVTYTLPDTIAPAVTINQDVGQADPTDSTPIHFKVVFDEPVTGFDSSDVLVSGTAGGSNVSVTGSGDTYNVYVNDVAGNGTIVATIPQGAAKDASDNESEASTSTDNQVTYYLNTLPVASDDSVSTSVNTPKNITLSAFDADSNPLTYTYSQPTHGEVTGTGPNVTYTPDTNFADSDSFTFYVNDGYGNSNTATISILVTPVCDNDEHVENNQCVPNDVDPPSCDQGYYWNGQQCVEDGGQCNPEASFSVVSDTNEEVDGGPALSVETWEHPAWLDESGDGVKWIWSDAEVVDPSSDETHTFTDTFTITGSATGGTLYIAADNGYVVTLNGNAVCSAPAESSNYAAYQNCVVAPELFVNGENTLSVEVKNLAYATQDPHTNPAGVIYKLEVDENECDTPVQNSCILPDEAGETVAIGTSPETTLQTILENAGYSLDASTDQKNFESWSDSGQKVYFTAKFLDKFAGHSHVFGYFVNGGAFVPLFRNGTVDPAYMSAPLKSPGDSVSFEVNNVNDIEFAIADWSDSTNTFYSTDASDNVDSAVHTLVYNPDDNEYVLAFEDLVIPSPSDEDYNDFVVALTVDRCENGATCEPGKELLENGGFEDTSALGSTKWNIFASDTIGWIADWLAPAGAPEIANLEIQEEGLNGWLASNLDDIEGTQWTELDSDWGGPSSSQNGEAGQVAISQTLDTVPGETYTVSFDFSPRPGTAAGQNAVEILANDNVIYSTGTLATAGNQTEWTRHTTSFVADSYSTTIAFRDAGSPNDSLGTLLDNTSVMCEEPEPKATLVATKIVCDDEADLPNWGAGEADITASTASNFLQTHPTCHLEPNWQFQWVTDADSNTNPGDNIVSPASAPWSLFGPTTGDGTITTQIPVGGKVWVREVLKDNYVPFSGQNTDQDVSAEIYCSTDVLNYDNWDWIDPVEADETYYCVAFNAPIESGEQCNPEASHVLLSSDEDGEDLLTQDESGPASLVALPHANWFSPSEGFWIWKDTATSPEDADVGTTETFTREFEIVGTPYNSTLTLAVDNGYSVKVNGNEVCSDVGEHNYESTVDCAVPAAYLQNGTNTITFEVVNIDHETANDPSNNPAGLYYKLVVNENECVVPEEPLATVTMCKTDEQGYALSGWSLYLAGAHVEDLAVPSNTPAGIDSSVLEDGLSYLALASGTWTNQSGANIVDAEYSTTDGWATPMDGYTGYQTDILELQLNSAFDPNSDWGPYSSAHEYAQSFIQSGNTSANLRIFDGSGTTPNTGWYGDNSGTLDVGLYKGYAGVTGEDGCVTFTDVPYGSYTAGEIMQDGWSHYATWDAESVVDGSSVVVNGESEHFTIQNREREGDGSQDEGEGTLIIKKETAYADEGTFDFDIGGNESFYDLDVNVNNAEGENSIVLPAGTYSVTETQQEDWEFVSVSCQYEGESEGVGIPYGHEITIYDGETVTCTFLNYYDDDSGGGGGSINGGPSPESDGAVLGASASEEQSCSPLLDTYMRLSGNNDAADVSDLQAFLNGEMGSGLPVTGFFGPLTDSAVHAFQKKYWEDVLAPWFGIEGSAIKTKDDSTGYVYKTTRWKINNIFCPGSEALPTLP